MSGQRVGYTGISRSVPLVPWGKAQRSKANGNLCTSTCQLTEEQQGCTSGNIKWNLNTGSPRQPMRGKLSQTGEKKVGEYQTAESGDSEKKPAEILMTIKY